jgi:hypothetical protein
VGRHAATNEARRKYEVLFAIVLPDKVARKEHVAIDCSLLPKLSREDYGKLICQKPQVSSS